MGTHGIDARTGTVIDFGVLTVVFATAAVTFSRPLGWVALVGAFAVAVSALVPALSTPAATLALALSVGTVMEQTRRSTGQRSGG